MLARSLQGFEFRPSQLQMSLLIRNSIHEKTPALIEAGTGTGKTFGYLIPVILSGKENCHINRHKKPSGTDLFQGHTPPE